MWLDKKPGNYYCIIKMAYVLLRCSTEEMLREWTKIRDLSEISRGGGGVEILNLGSEIRWPIPAMGAKFANPPLELGLKYHDPPPLVWMIKSSSCNTLGWVSIMKTQNIFLICSLSCYIHIYIYIHISITFRKPLFLYFFFLFFAK